MPSSGPDESSRRGPFYVPTSAYVIMRTCSALPAGLRLLSRLEARAHRSRLASTSVDRPVFITGIARAGTTITLEMLSQHPRVGTHRYADFVIPYLPIWWDWLLPRLGLRGLEQPVERIHRDRIQITRASPEAVEEMIWVQFFSNLHDPDQSNILDRHTHAPAFERFYLEHLRKLLLARGKQRYVTKNNSLIPRLDYLLRLMPDARVLNIIRHPVSHIASLMKQHRILHEVTAAEPRQVLLSRLAGHFEFGPHREVVNLGDSDQAREIADCWRSGREARGWALQWAAIYGHVQDQLERDPVLRQACHVVRYEDLCDRPREVLSQMLRHTGLPLDAFGPVMDEYAAKLSRPTYYRPKFTDAEIAEIATHAGPTAAQFGYHEQP